MNVYGKKMGMVLKSRKKIKSRHMCGMHGRQKNMYSTYDCKRYSGDCVYFNGSVIFLGGANIKGGDMDIKGQVIRIFYTVIGFAYAVLFHIAKML